MNPKINIEITRIAPLLSKTILTFFSSFFNEFTSLYKNKKGERLSPH